MNHVIAQIPYLEVLVCSLTSVLPQCRILLWTDIKCSSYPPILHWSFLRVFYSVLSNASWLVLGTKFGVISVAGPADFIMRIDIRAKEKFFSHYFTNLSINSTCRLLGSNLSSSFIDFQWNLDRHKIRNSGKHIYCELAAYFFVQATNYPRTPRLLEHALF